MPDLITLALAKAYTNKTALGQGAVGIKGDRGEQGISGKEVELRSDGTYIQYRYVGDTEWINIVPLSSLKGDTGNDGKIGAAGPQGDPGKDAELPEFQVQDNILQYKFLSDSDWIDLYTFIPVDLSDLEVELSNKVDKVIGKQLSTEDYTTIEKDKLTGIEVGAQVNTVNPADLQNKLEISNIKAGNNITLIQNGNDITINSIGEGEIEVVDHAQLNNLNYENSGHVGFASSSEIDGLRDLIDNIDIPVVPIKLSQLENDVDFITADDLVEPRNFTDNPIDLERESTGVLPIEKVDTSSLFSGSYDDLIGLPDIPEKTSDLLNDSGFITMTDIPSFPSLPTKTSDLVNDSEFITLNDIPATRDFNDNPISLTTEVTGILPIDKVDISSLPTYAFNGDETDTAVVNVDTDDKITTVVKIATTETRLKSKTDGLYIDMSDLLSKIQTLEDKVTSLEEGGVVPPLTVVTDGVLSINQIPITDAASSEINVEANQFICNKISWTPILVDDKFAPETVYTLDIQIVAKTGFDLTGIENIFSSNLGTVIGYDSTTRVVSIEFPKTLPEQTGDEGWEITYTFPYNFASFSYASNGRIPEGNWTGWDDKYKSVVNEDLYDSDIYPTEEDLPVALYAKYSTDSDWKYVPFDNFDKLSGANKVTWWGVNDDLNVIYIEGTNATGVNIQLKFIKKSN